jgi:hypothetical protein
MDERSCWLLCVWHFPSQQTAFIHSLDFSTQSTQGNPAHPCFRGAFDDASLRGQDRAADSTSARGKMPSLTLAVWSGGGSFKFHRTRLYAVCPVYARYSISSILGYTSNKLLRHSIQVLGHSRLLNVSIIDSSIYYSLKKGFNQG